MFSVHPHVRGVYTFKADGHTVHDGSSPRAWGLSFQPLRHFLKRRFIPTCVGFMIYDVRHALDVRFIPTCVGFMYGSQLPRPIFSGSSPRAWGLCIPLLHRLFRQRFIPTCVGFIPTLKSQAAQNAVHPHVRGVYAPDFHLIAGGLRFIPTCVGFMRLSWALSILEPVHPHVRGVYSELLTLLPLVHGSSPRAWGLCRSPGGEGMSKRFIPTCVGFMKTTISIKPKTSVHPHVRGVYTRKAFKKIRLSPSECRLNPQYCVLACLPVSSQTLAQCCWNIPSPHHLPCLWYRSDPKAAPEFWH